VRGGRSHTLVLDLCELVVDLVNELFGVLEPAVAVAHSNVEFTESRIRALNALRDVEHFVADALESAGHGARVTAGNTDCGLPARQAFDGHADRLGLPSDFIIAFGDRRRPGPRSGIRADGCTRDQNCA